MAWRTLSVLLLVLIIFLGTVFMSCLKEESPAVVVVVPTSNLEERMREAEERIHSLEIQLQMFAEGERERAALLHGFETIGR